MSSEWHSYRLGDLTTFKYGKFLAKSQLADQGFPVFSGYGVVGYLPEYQFDAPQLLMVCRGEGGTGDVKMSPPKCSITNLSIVFSVNEAKVTKNFLYWALKARDTRLLRTGSAQAQIVIGSLENFRVEIPPQKSEQVAIAGFLDSIDDRIILLRETNSTLEAIAQALFKSWFVDFDPVRAKQAGSAPEGMDEATAALFPDSFEDSELGLVPKGWRVSTLDGVSDVGIGKTPPRKEPHWFSENSDDIRWVSIRDMGSAGTFLSETSEYLTKEAIDRFNVRRVPDGTVLLSFKLTIGRVAITDGEMTTNEAIAHCKLSDQFPLASEYIYLHLKQFDYATLSSTSSIADAVNSKTVKAIPILVPSGDVVTAFQGMVGVIFERIKTVQQQAQTLATLRDTLLPRLISGQLRLPEAEAMLAEV